jgi:hypothetical protein
MHPLRVRLNKPAPKNERRRSALGSHRFARGCYESIALDLSTTQRRIYRLISYEVGMFGHASTRPQNRTTVGVETRIPLPSRRQKIGGGPYPRFPAKPRGFPNLHAPFLNERRTRGCVQVRVQEIRGISRFLRDVGGMFRVQETPRKNPHLPPFPLSKSSPREAGRVGELREQV